MWKHFELVVSDEARHLFSRALGCRSIGSSSSGNGITQHHCPELSDNDKITSQKKKFEEVSGPTWNSFERYLKKEYPNCRKCKLKLHWPSALISHLVNVHHGDEAIRLFGKNATCALCKTYSVPSIPKGSKIYFYAVKRHMRQHYHHVIPQEAKELLSLILRCHGKLPPIKQLDKLHMLLTPDDRSKLYSQKWRDCESFLRKEFPGCQICRIGHGQPSHVLEHAVRNHYGEEALKQFGSDNTCLICNDYSLPPVTTPKNPKSFLIKRHMTQHLEHVLPEKAKLLFLRAVKYDSHFLKGIKTQDCSSITKNIKQSTPEQPTEFKEVPQLGNTKSHPSLLACEKYFRDLYQNCNPCKRGHDSLSALKLHLTLAHYSNAVIELFGNDTVCPICCETVLRTKEIGTVVCNKIIKEHMSQHLEEFTFGKARLLLQKATRALSASPSRQMENIPDHEKATEVKQEVIIATKSKIFMQQHQSQKVNTMLQ